MLLGVSGSVAAIKAAEVAALLAAWADVRMVTTEVGRRFVSGQLPPCVACMVRQPARAVSRCSIHMSWCAGRLHSVIGGRGQPMGKLVGCGVPC